MKRNGFSKRIFSLGLIAALLLCALPARSQAVSRSTGAQIMVSLGDSYSSGEGIPPFYGQDLGDYGKLSNNDWVAHRSTQSWPGMLTLPGTSGTMASNRGSNWIFMADSGATTYDMFGVRGKDVKRTLGIEYSDTCYLPAQLEAFGRFEEGEVDYVTLTLGGNDANFVDIVTAANIGNTFLNKGDLDNKLQQTWDEFEKEGGIRDRLIQVYKEIWNAAGHQVTILVAGYPALLDPDGCVLFDSPECHVINRNVRAFNDAIEEAVAQCKKECEEEYQEEMKIYFVSVDENFTGHEAYTAFPYLNGVIVPAQSEDLETPGAFSAYSIHPNLSGARAYARAVQAVIDQLESQGEEQSAAYADFSIEGSWRSVGSYGFGQAQPGSTVTFDGEHCNFYSPRDTYEFYRSGGKWYLETKNVLWGDVLTFEVKIIDYDHIEIYYSSTTTELERISQTGSEAAPTPTESPGGSAAAPPTESVSGDSVPPGTYVNYTFGVIRNAFTFYGDHQVTMNALGVQGDGTYELRDGQIIITYQTNFSSETYVWTQSFSMSGDSIYIAGDEFVKES